MKGVLTVADQVRVLSRIWSDREGFVFLPWIDGKSKNKLERRKNYHEGPAFEWPADRDKIEAWLGSHTADDVYFTPCMFESKRRVEQEAMIETSLWADLDEADPEKLRGELRPTVAWESSPGRFQAVWLLSDGRMGASWPGDINHRLTLEVGADPSGWDTTQLLRVPGRKNFKFGYRAEGQVTGVQGELMWDNGPRYSWRDFENLPEVVSAGNLDEARLIDEDIVDQVDRHDIWGKVRLKVSHRVRELMGFRRESQITEDMDRSTILWEIGRDLADAGCNAAQIIAIVRPTVWNKYSGRGDQMRRLKELAGKVIKESKEQADDGDDGGALEVINDEKPGIRWLSDAMLVHMPRPTWLINNVWSRGGCGFIAGDPKSYKSWIGIDMAVSIATGRPFLGDPRFAILGGPQNVLYIQEEDSELVVRERLGLIVDGRAEELHWHGRMVMDGDDVYWEPPQARIPIGFQVRTGFISSDPGWQAWLADTVAENEIVQVIIDTMGTTSGDVDTDRSSDLMNKILRPLRDVSAQTGAGITIVHHNRKGSETQNRGGQRMLGSVALHAWVNDALYVHTRESLSGGRTKVRLERESKAATEERWIVEIPRMGTDRTGHRTVWTPLVGEWNTSEEPVTTGDLDNPDNPDQKSPTPRRAGAIAGVYLAKTKLKGTGATSPERAKGIAELTETTGQTPGELMKQIRSGMKNGFIFETEDNRFWVDVTKLPNG